uniref:AMOP domain-containing protein n=1 Tax=Globodera pallida TaxID=36090 RepID=A0A183CHM0_GLOPA
MNHQQPFDSFLNTQGIICKNGRYMRLTGEGKSTNKTCPTGEDRCFAAICTTWDQPGNDIIHWDCNDPDDEFIKCGLMRGLAEEFTKSENTSCQCPVGEKGVNMSNVAFELPPEPTNAKKRLQCKVGYFNATGYGNATIGNCFVPVWQGGRQHVKQKLDTFVYDANDNPDDDYDKQTNDNHHYGEDFGDHYGKDFGDHYGEANDENGETFWDYGQSQNDYGRGTNDYHGGKSQCTSQRGDLLHGADCDWNFGFDPFILCLADIISPFEILKNAEY